MLNFLLLMLFAETIGLLFLLGKVHALRKAMVEIGEGFRDRLSSDTNTLIDISSRDACARQLASHINAQLRLLRQQRHRYQTGDRELKEAVTGISHDLRTPLTAICGYGELMAREPLTENAAHYLARIQNRAEGMRKMTEELFRYSLAVSQSQWSPEPVCLNDAVEQAIAAFYGELTARGIQPVISICQTKVVLPLNREALQRILSNLLSNACKYSDGDLSVTLMEDGTLHLTNSAHALTPVLLGRLFDRFFTVESGENSCGLGLSIARNLTEQLGGDLSACLDNGNLTLTLRWK